MNTNNTYLFIKHLVSTSEVYRVLKCSKAKEISRIPHIIIMALILRMVFIICVITLLISMISTATVKFVKSKITTPQPRCKKGFYCFENGVCVDDCPPIGWEVSTSTDQT